MLLEEYKNCVPERTMVYLNEQKVTTLQEAAVLAEEFALTHRSTFVGKRDTPTNETSCKASIIVRGIEMGYVPAPLHRVHVQSKLDSGVFDVAARCSFPISGVEFIMGNYLAGNKVLPSPEVVDIPDTSQHRDEVLKSHPDVFSVSVLTRSQARKQEEDAALADSLLAPAFAEDILPSIGLPESSAPEQDAPTMQTVIPPFLTASHESLSEAQKGDSSLAKCFAGVDEQKTGEEGTFVLWKYETTV
ncbi:hypothetical protein FQN60_002125 [Etheostoma spectabile]|uniref:Uncharacterized protein n=1 Tax=Etheostoma spectabile TaxID=54343 RepID=A0A5J5D953_9PERO|nr:hypothetical protein FQN60_002125 [Etheostoma spectabile]